MLSADIQSFIDLNIHQVPRALGLGVPSIAGATILGVPVREFDEYLVSVEADVRVMACEMLDDADLAAAVDLFPVPAHGTIIAIGDSITSYRRGYVEILRSMLAVRRGADHIRVLNMAESGYTSTIGREIVHTICVAQRPNLVFVKLGVNDCKRFGDEGGRTLVSPGEYAENMAAIVVALKRHTEARVVLLTPTPVPEEIVNSYPDFVAMRMHIRNSDILSCAQALRSLAESEGVMLIDLFSLFGGEPEASLFRAEGLHPAPRGHRLMLDRILHVWR